MKLSQLIAAGGAALASYWLVSNREKIAQETNETIDLAKTAQASYQNIQKQLSTIQSYQEPLRAMTEDLQYKIRTYQQSIAGNLEEIQKIAEKYEQEQK
ncbi:chemotaxis protein [Streptococcus sp. 20-1249]|uniref:chemotaxis protein n=1 Tax=Streptococcus hepaticus TaxID=3349163 RepID=UPI0037493B8F